MQQEEIKNLLEQWIVNFVEEKNPKLDNWPPCPFAKKARLENKIEIIFVDSILEIVYMIENNINKLHSNKDVLIFCIDKINSKEIIDIVDQLNKIWMSNDIVFLRDHPDINEELNGVKSNFGHCALILAQKLQELNKFSDQLRKKGYYNSWSQEDIDRVVTWRTKKNL